MYEDALREKRESERQLEAHYQESTRLLQRQIDEIRTTSMREIAERDKTNVKIELIVYFLLKKKRNSFIIIIRHCFNKKISLHAVNKILFSSAFVKQKLNYIKYALIFQLSVLDQR